MDQKINWGRHNGRTIREVWLGSRSSDNEVLQSYLLDLFKRIENATSENPINFTFDLRFQNTELDENRLFSLLHRAQCMVSDKFIVFDEGNLSKSEYVELCSGFLKLLDNGTLRNKYPYPQEWVGLSEAQKSLWHLVSDCDFIKHYAVKEQVLQIQEGRELFEEQQEDSALKPRVPLLNVESVSLGCLKYSLTWRYLNTTIRLPEVEIENKEYYYQDDDSDWMENDYGCACGENPCMCSDPFNTSLA